MNKDDYVKILWCDLNIVTLKIYSYDIWETKKVLVYDKCPENVDSKPNVNIYICKKNDEIFDNALSYREKIMVQGLYLGHHFGTPAKLKLIDDYNIAFYHPDPGKIIWCYLIKYILSIFAYKNNMFHLKGAAIEYKGKGFIFLGRGGSGKTEMIDVLCHNGAKFIANTHILIKDNYLYGVKSNIRIRRNGREEYVSANSVFNNIYDEVIEIGSIFWVNYSNIKKSNIKKMNPSELYNNMLYFSEAVNNWEMKEDIADYFNSDPFLYAKFVENNISIIKKLCLKNAYYLNLDIHTKEGLDNTLRIMGTNI